MKYKFDIKNSNKNNWENFFQNKKFWIKISSALKKSCPPKISNLPPYVSMSI